MPDLYSIRGVLGELAGYDALAVKLTVSEDGDNVTLSGSPVELMTQLEEYGMDAQIVAFGFIVNE